jgi:hypothetical protein
MESWTLTWILTAAIGALGVLAWGHPLGASTGLLALLAPVSPMASLFFGGPPEDDR